MRIRVTLSILSLLLAPTTSSGRCSCQAAVRPAFCTPKPTITTAFRKTTTTTTTISSSVSLFPFLSSSSPSSSSFAFHRHHHNHHNIHKLPLASRKSLILLSSSAKEAIKESNSPSSSAAVSSSTTSATTTTTTTMMPLSAPPPPPPQSVSLSDNGVVPFQKPKERVIPPNLPVVYVYDHCPFCVRVRLALGLKNVKHRLYFLANDDVETPVSLVGTKISPILEWNPNNDAANVIIMSESMDIIQWLDSDDRLGPVQVIQPATGRTDLSTWQTSVRDLLRGLQRPRYVATGLLPEFQQLDGRHAFVKNHPMPPYGTDEWKSMTMAEKLTIYAEGMAKDPATDVEELNRKLVELDDIICCEYHCSKGGLSYDDIDLFSRLRSITIIKDVKWPAKLRQYMDLMAELADVPLYDEMAL